MARIGSKKSLVTKLGIKDGMKLLFINSPQGYDEVLGRLPKNVVVVDDITDELDFVQMFSKSKKEVDVTFPKLVASIRHEGIIWVCWPKGSSKIKTDLTGSMVREVGNANGMVDVKVSSIDDTWSGLKFVNKAKEKD